ncbi:MAG: GNAT family N-acetyltransferase [Flavipsychrobacter sp.]|nr:GNAT family N-acetyltransferase [Flavipsychrobacter sp.]
MQLNTEYTFRIALPSDTIQLVALGLEAYGQFEHTLTNDNWQTMQTNLKNENTYTALLQKANGYVCEHSGKLIGMAFLVPKGNPTTIFEAGWAYIRMVGVATGYEGQGIAKKLTSMCVDHAIQTNEKVIALHTSEIMTAARHIYEKLGFKQQKEVGPFFGKKYWLYTLVI